LVTALVPSEMACLESSPGRMSRTAVWISREEMVDRWLYEASLDASEAIRSKISETKELRIAMALLLIISFDSNEVERASLRDTSVGVDLLEDLVDVGRVGLDPLLGPLLTTVSLSGGGLCGLDISHSRYEWERREFTLAGALDAAAGALAAWEEGALDATEDLGG